MAAISKQERTGLDNESFEGNMEDIEKKLQASNGQSVKSTENLEKTPETQLHRVLGIRLHNSLLGPKWLLVFLCVAALVQGMIFTNVVISSLEKRFGLQSTTSGIIAGAYDMGSLLAVIPVTYFGGRPGSSKPKYIAWGMFVVGTGSLIFSSPHFITDNYIQSLDINSSITNGREGYLGVLCSPDSQESPFLSSTENGTLLNSQQKENDAVNLSLYKYVFLLGQLLHGIGSAALITLGTTLLDESVKKASVPLYIGILNACFVIGPAFGFLVGGQFLNVFTEFYLVAIVDLNIDTSSPKWVGAWWIGFLLIVVLSYLCAFLIGLYPASIPGSEESEVNKLAIESSSSSISDELVIHKCDFGKVSELPRAIYNLLTNATYACISFGATMDGFLLAALAAFMPKYMESQFGLTPGYAAILIGILIVPAGAGGSLLGGFIVKFFELSRTQSIGMYIACQIAILPMYFGFLLYCPNPPFEGVNTQYHQGPSSQQLSARCNANCTSNCDVMSYMPICGANGVSYFNPCYAGCNTNGTKGIFSDCSCIEGPEPIGLEGICPSNCDYTAFAALFFFQIFFTFLATMPGLVASLRSVEPLYRSLSLGLQTILVRGLGTVPGPIVFGLILDKSCLLWNDRDGGNCLLYDNYWSSRLIFAVLIIWRFVGAIFFLFAYFQSKKSKLADS